MRRSPRRRRQHASFERSAERVRTVTQETPLQTGSEPIGRRASISLRNTRQPRCCCVSGLVSWNGRWPPWRINIPYCGHPQPERAEVRGQRPSPEHACPSAPLIPARFCLPAAPASPQCRYNLPASIPSPPQVPAAVFYPSGPRLLEIGGALGVRHRDGALPRRPRSRSAQAGQTKPALCSGNRTPCSANRSWCGATAVGLLQEASPARSP